MPDESQASSEHALIQEITSPLVTLPDDAVPAVADADFPVVLRGYDRLAVDEYVRRTTQLVAELQATRSPEAAVRRALGRVGEEVSGILQRAHETAGQITTTSRAEAEDRLEAARQEAAQITAEAERRVKELDAETDRIWSERHRIVEDARDLARQLLGLAESAAERFPAEDVAGDTRAASTRSDDEHAAGSPGVGGDEGAQTLPFAVPFEPADSGEPLEDDEALEDDEPLEDDQRLGNAERGESAARDDLGGEPWPGAAAEPPPTREWRVPPDEPAPGGPR